MTGRRTPLEALVDNLNVEAMAEIPSPQEVQERLPLTEGAALARAFDSAVALAW